MAGIDIALLGATGFTGGLTADHLAQNLPVGSRWAVAGRDVAKLRELARRLDVDGGIRPDVIEADVRDESSMAALAARTRVLATTVGPYLQHGEGAVRAAAEAGIGYLDLTGEPQFVDESWIKYHEIARETGARLIHACGFDSIPHDLGVLHAVRQLPDDVPISMNGYVRADLAPSGGTYHSAVNQIGAFRQSARVAAQRRSLEYRPPDRVVRGSGGFGRHRHGKGWAVPLPTIDPQIVLRSARALPEYGPEFTYGHFAHVRRTRTLAVSAVGLGALAVGAQVPPVRRLLLKGMDVGDGPSAEKRARAWFILDLHADAGGHKLHTRVSGDDPGYGGTAAMLGQAAMCLAFDDGLPHVSGQTTTAVALGQALIDRLHPHTLRFETL